jgi:hypothetical protein
MSTAVRGRAARRHDLETVDQLRGRLSRRSIPDPAAFERANYIRTLASHAAGERT